VAVKGKKDGVKIYTAKRALEAEEKKAWDLHNAAMQEYYTRNFDRAAGIFRSVGTILHDDFPSSLLMERCQEYIKDPPPMDWKGVEVMKTK
jgi:adenylate cyclase